MKNTAHLAIVAALASFGIASCGASTPAASTPRQGTDEAATATPGATEGEPETASQPSATEEVKPPSCPPPEDHERIQLSAEDVKARVDRSQSNVHRLCWEPAYEDNPEGPDTVRVAAQVTVDTEGRVTDITAVGGDAYPGFAACVGKQIRSWCFPGTKQPSSIMFPLLFKRSETGWVRKSRGGD